MPTESSLISLDDGRLLVASEYLPAFLENHLDTFDRIMDHELGTVVRSVPGRTTIRIKLTAPDGRPLMAYLKRYDSAYLSARRLLLRLLHCAEGTDEALREWRMIHRLREYGFNTPAPMAIGQRVRSGIVTASFVITAEISDGVPADVYLKMLDYPQRREFLGQLADLTRRFQDASFIHRDYYLHHIFVVAGTRQPELVLIDLQRASGPGRFRARWLLKDISGLALSAWRAGASRSDLLWLYKRCFEKRRLKPDDKRHIREILARVDRTMRHKPRYGEPDSPSAVCAAGQTS